MNREKTSCRGTRERNGTLPGNANQPRFTRLHIERRRKRRNQAPDSPPQFFQIIRIRGINFVRNIACKNGIMLSEVEDQGVSHLPVFLMIYGNIGFSFRASDPDSDLEQIFFRVRGSHLIQKILLIRIPGHGTAVLFNEPQQTRINVVRPAVVA